MSEMINSQFVTKDIAIRLALLGFNEPCFAGYDNKVKENHFLFDKLCYPAASDRNSTVKPRVYKKTCHQNAHITKAPTWEQAIEFFETRGMYTNIGPEFYKDGINWLWQILWYLPEEEQSEHDIYDGSYFYGDNGEYPTRQLAIKASVEHMTRVMTEKGKAIIDKIITQDI